MLLTTWKVFSSPLDLGICHHRLLLAKSYFELTNSNVHKQWNISLSKGLSLHSEHTRRAGLHGLTSYVRSRPQCGHLPGWVPRSSGLQKTWRRRKHLPFHPFLSRRKTAPGISSLLHRAACPLPQGQQSIRPGLLSSEVLKTELEKVLSHLLTSEPPASNLHWALCCLRHLSAAWSTLCHYLRRSFVWPTNVWHPPFLVSFQLSPLSQLPWDLVSSCTPWLASKLLQGQPCTVSQCQLLGSQWITPVSISMLPKHFGLWSTVGPGNSRPILSLNWHTGVALQATIMALWTTANSPQMLTWQILTSFTSCLLQQRFERNELLSIKKMSGERSTGATSPCLQEDNTK